MLNKRVLKIGVALVLSCVFVWGMINTFVTSTGSPTEVEVMRALIPAEVVTEASMDSREVSATSEPVAYEAAASKPRKNEILFSELMDDFMIETLYGDGVADEDGEYNLFLLQANDTRIVHFVSPETGIEYEIDLDRLNSAWNSAEAFEWDNRECHNYVAVIKNFLIDQMGVTENIAFAIMGNSANEGGFGMEQKSYDIFDDLEQAVSKLRNSSVHRGYGIIQWTSMNRRNKLAKFYEEADKLGISFQEVMFVAELVFMYEEVQQYNLFSSYDEQVGLEDACGRVAREYEGYTESKDEWKKKNGEYTLVASKGSGYNRLKYAKKFKELWGKN